MKVIALLICFGLMTTAYTLPKKGGKKQIISPFIPVYNDQKQENADEVNNVVEDDNAQISEQTAEVLPEVEEADVENVVQPLDDAVEEFDPVKSCKGFSEGVQMFFPNPKNEVNYYVCVGEKLAVEMSCPFDTVFIPSENICGRPGNKNEKPATVATVIEQEEQEA